MQAEIAPAPTPAPGEGIVETPAALNTQVFQPRSMVVSSSAREYRIFLIAGEHSGDALGAKLMAALNERLKGRVRYLGVGGEGMAREGLISQFPISEVAVMGPSAILRRLPRILKRVFDTVSAAVAAEPDVLVIIDSPEFTHPIAKRFRRRMPDVPVIDYVSPSVWAWRPGRARKMRRYVDHVLALLPFEPAEHARLGGPPCTYVGHPLIERLAWIRALDPRPLAERLGLDLAKPIVVVLPGSRASEVSLLMRPFGEALYAVQANGEIPQVLLPVVDHVRGLVEKAIVNWPVVPHLLSSEEDKWAAYKLASAALAASGTVTLELALAGTPTVVAYKVDGIAAHLRFLLKAPSVVLANLVLGENVFPELLQEDCTGGRLAAELAALLENGPARARQMQGLAAIPQRMQIGPDSPSVAAAEIVMAYAEHGRRHGMAQRGRGAKAR